MREEYQTVIKKIGKHMYSNVHHWLQYHFGKADKCEFCCNPNYSRYHWALLKGKEYEKIRENFIMLCPSCHRKYDGHPDINRRISEKLKGHKYCVGRKVSQAHRDRIRKTLSIPIVQKTLSGDILRVWDSQKQACDILGIGNITAVLKGKRKTSAGFKWEYQ